MRLVIAGAGPVGVTTALGFANHGHSIDLIDMDAARVAALQAGRVPFDEASLEGALDGIAWSRVRVRCGYPESLETPDFAFICVDTQQGYEGHLDVSRVFAAASQLVRTCSPDVRLVLRSTATPGTAALVEQLVLDSGGRRGTVLVNPEFLTEGTALYDFEDPHRRVIGGTDPDAVEALAELYSFSDTPTLVMDPLAAELTKLASNAALAARVSMANEIAQLAIAVGADVDSVLRGVTADPRIGQSYFRPGIGFGGSCLPKDLSAFRATARQHGVSIPLMDGASTTNELAVKRLADRAEEVLVSGARRVAVIGVGYKPGIASIRGSQSVELVRRLMAMGMAVSIYDPFAADAVREVFGAYVAYCDSIEAAVSQADLTILTQAYDGGELPESLVIDGLGRRANASANTANALVESRTS